MFLLSEFALSDTNKADIDAAKAAHEDATDKLLLNFLEYPGLGKADFKTLKLSPDSMMQLAFQVRVACFCILPVEALFFYCLEKKFAGFYQCFADLTCD